MRRQRFAVVCRSVLFVGVTLAGVPSARRRRPSKDLQTPCKPLVMKA